MAPAGYPLSPLLFLIPILTVIVLRIASDPVRSSIGLAGRCCLVFPVASLVLSPIADRRWRAIVIRRLNQTDVSESTLDGPSAVPIVGTGSSS